MIEKLSIRNWQSLRQVDLDLGRLTVIVGPSSSGKSALLRAVRAVASNVRGHTAITRGATKAAVSVHTGERIVTLERSETTGLYRLLDTTTASEQVYTKLAGAVPPAITEALGVQPATTGMASLHFAGQFDPPFLLDETGAAVARVLGDLTNVSTIFVAVQAANTQRRARTTALRTREGDLEQLRRQAASFADLADQLASCDQAERLAADATEHASQVNRLRQLLDTLDTATVVAERLNAPEVPGDTALLAAAERLGRVKQAVSTWAAAQAARAAAADRAQVAVFQERTAADQLALLLDAIPVCPTCQRPMH